MRRLLAGVSILVWGTALALGELGDTLSPSPDNPAIGYFTQPVHDPVAELNRHLDDGTAHLRYDPVAGYLRSVLEALHVPVESQMAVFSKTSFQAAIINPKNPRTLFFNDSVAVGWMHGGFIELAAQDPRQGTVFYVLEQKPADQPRFRRQDSCLSCHVSDASLGVPGMMVRSTYTEPDGMPRLLLGASLTDHRTPLEERWGGWYVTGSAGSARHLGNAFVTDEDHPESMVTPATLHRATLRDQFDTQLYLSPYSDIAALLVFNHQMHMMNLITRVGWEARLAAAQHRDVAVILRDPARELVDYLLFSDEASLPAPIRGSAGFTERFAAEGPRDHQGRSLRQLDLNRRLFRYPCSYMIYSDAFEQLADPAKQAIYQRLWQVLSGQIQDPRYARLSLADRSAIAAVLRDTKPGLPSFFQAVTR